MTEQFRNSNFIFSSFIFVFDFWSPLRRPAVEAGFWYLEFRLEFRISNLGFRILNYLFVFYCCGFFSFHFGNGKNTLLDLVVVQVPTSSVMLKEIVLDPKFWNFTLGLGVVGLEPEA